MFQHYQFNRDAIAQAAVAAAASLAENMPGESPEAFAAKVIADRLRRAPGNYLQYGPYWWAVKEAMRGAGHDFGDEDVPAVRAAYSGGLTPYQAMVAGEEFRSYYLAQFMAETATFALGGDDEAEPGAYVLFDIDMEILRNGSAAGGSLAMADAIREPDEPILDDVRVHFEEGGELWTAAVQGGLVDDSASLIADMQRDGRIGRAIDAAKGLRAQVLDAVGPTVAADVSERTVHVSRR